MLRDRLFALCIGISVLAHLVLTVFLFFYAIHLAPARPPAVVPVELTELPRSTDFLPPRPGIVEGGPPPAPAPAPAKPPAAAPKPKPAAPRPVPPPPARKLPSGKVPELPVDPNLLTQREYPRTAGKEPPPEAKEGEGGKEGPAGARTGRPDGDENAPETAPGAAQEAERGAAPQQTARKEPPVGRPAPPPRGDRKPLKDLFPSFSDTVRRDRGEAGIPGPNPGGAPATAGKAAKEGAFTEERRSGFHLEAINKDSSVQFISYYDHIRQRIYLVWQYPYEAAVAGIQGDVRVRFSIGPDGRLIGDPKLLQGSGSRILDDEAVRAIRKAAPFNRIPARYNMPRFDINAHFYYENGGARSLR